MKNPFGGEYFDDPIDEEVEPGEESHNCVQGSLDGEELEARVAPDEIEDLESHAP